MSDKEGVVCKWNKWRGFSVKRGNLWLGGSDSGSVS